MTTTMTTTQAAAFTLADLARAAATLARDIARAAWDWGDRPGEWRADGETEWEDGGGNLRAEMSWSAAETVACDEACGCAGTTSRRLWLDATLMAWDEAADEWRDITTPAAVAAIRDAAGAALD
ncbi:MAG TPA: hypothetical protein IAA99_02955 [Candidatus Avibacteroides faecavium]|nr:hypothetical protein [Candidatus Avibacteroides faecavium]